MVRYVDIPAMVLKCLYTKTNQYLAKETNDIVDANINLKGEHTMFYYKGESYLKSDAQPKDLSYETLDKTLHERMDTVLEERHNILTEHEFLKHYIHKVISSIHDLNGIKTLIPANLFITKYSSAMIYNHIFENFIDLPDIDIPITETEEIKLFIEANKENYQRLQTRIFTNNLLLT